MCCSCQSISAIKIIIDFIVRIPTYFELFSRFFSAEILPLLVYYFLFIVILSQFNVMTSCRSYTYNPGKVIEKIF